MTLSIQLKDFRSQGVCLISPADPGFDARARPRIGPCAHLALKLKPYIAIVSNQSSRAIVALATRWIVMRRFGQDRESFCHHRYPEGLFGGLLEYSSPNNRPILPGQDRVVSHGWALEQWGEDSMSKYLLRRFRFDTFRDVWCATKLCIELDTVIFEDGLLLGAGKSRLAEDFEACVKAREYWYSRVLQDLQSGKSIEEVTAYTNTVLEQLKKAVQISEIKRHWKATAIMQARRALLAGRNEAIDRLRQALGRQPFVMRRPA